MKLVYHLSDAARKRIFVETGRNPGQAQSLEVDPADLSRDDRALLVERDPSLTGHATLSYEDWQSFGVAPATLQLNAPTADAVELLAAYRDAIAAGRQRIDTAEAERIEAEITRYNAWSDSREPGLLNTSNYKRSPRRQEWIAAHAAAKATAKRLQEEQAEWKRRDEAAREAEKTRRVAERTAWILQHGSSRLKKCVEQDYNCQRLYVVERAAVEFPGYVVDFDDKAAWKERSGPSEAALDEAKRVGGAIVWVTRFSSSDDPDRYDEDDEYEAVVVRQYLGKYDLVKRI